MSVGSPPLRILLAYHASCHDGVAGANTRRLFVELRRLGHEPRLVTIERQRMPPSADHRAILADPLDTAATIHFAPPTFIPTGTGWRRFEDLSAREWLDYRDTLREALDDEIRDFDPHLVHAQHVWLFAHLALEAGVPYVATVWPEELEAAADERFVRVAHEAAENAGQLLVHDATLKHRLLASFPHVDRERVVELADDDPGWLERIGQAYRTTLTNRFGERFRS